MKKLKIIGFTVILMIGFIIPGCEQDDDCGGSSSYFDVLGIDEVVFLDSSNTVIAPNETVALDELGKIFIGYETDYHSIELPERDWSFSLIPSAYACSPIFGDKGSKTEALVDFSITTLNDFDDDHLANSNINDLFDYRGSSWELLTTPISLTQFLNEQTGNLQEEDMFLTLKKAPELNQAFKIKVAMELSTGEMYEFETAQIFITP